MQKLYLLFIVLLVGYLKAHPTDITNGFPVENAPYYAQVWQFERLAGDPGSGGQGSRVGGTLISDRHVITGVSGIKDGDWQPYLWEILIGCKGDFDCDVVIESNFSIAHYQYDKNTGENDIRVVYLPHPIRFTDRIQPAILSVQSEKFPPEGQIGLIVGFRYNKLLGSYQETMSDEECGRHTSLPRSKSFCTIDRLVGSSICGYYGNGFIFKWKYDNGSYLQGLLSEDYSSCKPGANPVRFTRMHYYREWIRALTGV